MSMIGKFRRLSDIDLARLRAAPHEIHAFLDPGTAGSVPDELDVDKAWHGIHYLLTGTAWGGSGPLAFVCGGTNIGDDTDDVGYGPARGFTSADVQAIASALAVLPPDRLRERFDPSAMMAAEVYPTIWDRPPDQDDSLGYVLAYYEELRDFVLATSERGMAMLVYLC